jgi:hypothetical protein
MADNGALKNRLGRSGMGCALYAVIYLAVAYGLDQFTAERVMPDARPWIGAAAALFITLGLASVWGLLTGYTRQGGSSNTRTQLLANAHTPSLLDKDGPLLVTGTVQLDSAMGEPLLSPIGGTPCVAYVYRMYYVTSNATERRHEVPVYWGSGCLPFRIASATARVRVEAIPQLRDRPQMLRLDVDTQRAREYIAATRFEIATGITGAIGTAFEIANAVSAEGNSAYRRDWKNKAQPVDPATLILEETVLAVGVTATLAGPWSVTRQAIVPHIDGMDALTVTASTGGPEKMHLDDAGVPPSTLAGVLTAVGLLTTGVGVLWGALVLLALKN